MFDAIIVGGSNAGLSAALILGRSRRRVLVLDHGRPRNAPAQHMHSFLSRDGMPPDELRRIGREQLSAYPDVEVRNAAVGAARQTERGFAVVLDDGTELEARKLLLATGVSDDVSVLEGLAACWGVSAFHCPYCHGWEVRDQPLAVYGAGAAGMEFIQLLFGWSRDLVLCSDGPAGLSDDERQRLARHEIGLREETIVRLDHTEGRLSRIIFESGAPLERAALFIRPAQRQQSTLSAQLGCEFAAAGPLPHLIAVDAMMQTTVAGVYAAGDIVTPMQQAMQAAASGSFAGAALNRALLHEDFNRD